MDVGTQPGRPAEQAIPVWRRRWVKIVAVVAVVPLACAVIERSLG